MAPPRQQQQQQAARPSGEPLLVIDGVGKSHDGDSQLFSDVSLTVCRGDRLAVVGANGSGVPGRPTHETRVKDVPGISHHSPSTQHVALPTPQAELRHAWCLTGKTTLLRIMAGVSDADSGAVKRMDSVRLGYLEQDPAMDPE